MNMIQSAVFDTWPSSCKTKPVHKTYPSNNPTVAKNTPPAPAVSPPLQKKNPTPYLKIKTGSTENPPQLLPSFFVCTTHTKSHRPLISFRRSPITTVKILSCWIWVSPSRFVFYFISHMFHVTRNTFLCACISNMEDNWVDYKNQRLQNTDKATEHHTVFAADKKNDFHVPLLPPSQISSQQGH